MRQLQRHFDHRLAGRSVTAAIIAGLVLTCLFLTGESRQSSATMPQDKDRPDQLVKFPPPRSRISGTQATGGLVVSDLSERNPASLVSALLSGDIVVSNVSYKGIISSAGSFTGGNGIIGFDQGIILSSGSVFNVIGPNQFTGATAGNGVSGDSSLDALIPGLITRDATVLEFDFVPTGNVLSFQYVFASEEYNEFVYSNFNDVFGFFLNGQNIALLPGTTTPVTINNVNGGKPLGTNPANPQFYINNDGVNSPAALNTEMDGLTVVLTATAPINAGKINHIKLAIADASDNRLDSNVFIKASSFTSIPSKGADLAVAQTAEIVSKTSGPQVNYNITITNSGPDAADAVTVTDNLPDTLTFLTCNATQGGICGGSGNNQQITFNSIPAGTTATITLTARVNCSPNGGTSLVNTARGSASTPDPNQNNNSATTTLSINLGSGPPLLTIAGGKSEFDFGPTPAMREISPNAPSQTFTIENPGCAPVTVKLQRVGADVTSGRISNPDDSAIFSLFLVGDNGAEIPVPIGPGASPLQLIGGQKQTFRLRFHPLIPILSGKTTSLFANQAIPDVITSQLTITPENGAPTVVNVTGRVATPLQLIHPSDSRLPPLIIFTRSALEYNVECSVHDPNLDLYLARYQFLDQNDRPAGLPADLELTQPIAQRGLVRGQSFTIIQKFAGPLQSNVAKVQVTLFDKEVTIASAKTLLGTGEPSLANVSAASYQATGLATESMAAAFGTNFSGSAQSATTVPLPTSLAGTTVRVRDGAGTERLAPLFFASPTQINYMIPAGTRVGAATVSIQRSDQTTVREVIQIAATAPALFSANANGQGAASAVLLRLTADGQQKFEPVAQYDQLRSQFVTLPIHFGSGREQLYLVLFGSGVRYRDLHSKISAKIGGQDVQIIYAGAQGSFVGLDQINLLLPSNLSGRGEVDVVLTIDGKQSNAVKVNFGNTNALVSLDEWITTSIRNEAAKRAGFSVNQPKVPGVIPILEFPPIPMPVAERGGGQQRTANRTRFTKENR